MKQPLLWLLLAAGFVLSGCAAPLHARQLQDLQPVQTLGYDGAPGAVTVSVSDRQSAPEEKAVRMAARGESLVRACEELQSFCPRGELFFAHARFVLAGEAAAEAGLTELLDWFSRSAQTRLRLPLFLVRGADAAALVTGSEDQGYEITALLSALEERTKRQGELRCYTLLDTLRSLNEYGAALCCALEPRETGENAPSAEEGALTALPLGYGVLRGDRLRGWLDQKEARGAGLLRNEAGEISYTLPLGEGGAVLTLRSAHTRWTKDGSRLLARLRVTAGLTGLWAAGELTEARRRELTEALGARLAEECAAALTASSRLEADFLALGLGEEELRELEARVEVRVSLTQSYDSKAAPLLRGEAGKEEPHG